MNNNWYRVGIIICLILLAACSTRHKNSAPSPQPEIQAEAKPSTKTNECQYESAQTPNVDWEDRTIFQPTLNEAGQQYLYSFPEATVYHLSLTIPEELTDTFTGWVEVRYFNRENFPLNEIYFRLFPNYSGGILSVDSVEVDDAPVTTQLESGDTALRIDLPQQLAPGDNVIIKMDYQLSLGK